MKKSISIILAAATIAVALCAAVTVCWLDESSGSVRFDGRFHGSTEAAYFAGGTGAENSPYEIKSAVHLYNFAWLQYLGYFNMNPDFNNGLTQSHFVVSDNIDMSGFRSAIPPIGTTEYPFIGVFDGGNNTVRSVTVSNEKGTGDNTLKIRPSNAEFNGTALLHVAGGGDEVSIAGLFGVTGDYDGYIATYKAAHPGFTDENAAAMTVKNFYADKLHVRSGSAATLTGLVAGYAGSGISNVGVYRGDINYASGASGLTAISGDTAVTSKYALVGAVNENVVEWSDAEGTGGDNPDWGGSVDMKSLYGRLQSFRANATQKTDNYTYNTTNNNTITTKTVTKTVYRYYNVDEGQADFSSGGADSSVHYLTGGKILSGIAYGELDDGVSGFLISDGNGNYLTLSSTSAYYGANTPTTDVNRATTWYLENGALYAYSDDTKIYINTSNWGGNVFTLANTNNTTWTRNGNQLYGTYTGTTYKNYLQIYGGYWRALSNIPVDLTITPVTKRRYLTGTLYKFVNDDGETTQTYLPILTDENYKTAENNVGYITSGAYDDTADIRVRKDRLYQLNVATNNNNINAAFEQDKLEVLTVNKNTGNLVRIADNYNSGNTSVHGNISGYDKIGYGELGLVNYSGNDGARAGLGNTFTQGTDAASGTSIYGLHFMNATISTRNTFRAPSVKIENNSYENYQMVSDAVNFRTNGRGNITFFAGTYYEDNNSFFSLHHVIRNGNDINSIKKISKIYKRSGNQTYVYKYADGSYSVGNIDENTLTLAFDCDWIMNPGNVVKNAVYYFEIPVNGDTEYALGPSGSGNGAYLMYLDIGASATGGSEGKDHAIKSLYFVNTDTVTLDASGNYPEFNHVTFIISNAETGGSPWVMFERNTTANDDGTTSVRYNFAYIGNITPKGKGVYDDTLTQSRDG